MAKRKRGRPRNPPKPKRERLPRGRQQGANSAIEQHSPKPEDIKFMRGGRLSLPDDDVEDSAAVPDFPEIKDIRQRIFLQALAVCPRIGRAARAAGISTGTTWNWRYNDPDPVFMNAYYIAWKLGIERVEDEMWRRGREGYEKPVYHQGRLVGTERVFSDTASIFMLKGALPEKYRERVEQSGPGGGPIQTQLVDPDTLTDAQLLDRIEMIKRALAEPVKQMAAAAVEAKVQELSEIEADRYEQTLAKRNGNGS